MDYSILSNWTSPFPILGLSGVLFSFSVIYFAKRGVWSGSALFPMCQNGTLYLSGLRLLVKTFNELNGIQIISRQKACWCHYSSKLNWQGRIQRGFSGFARTPSGVARTPLLAKIISFSWRFWWKFRNLLCFCLKLHKKTPLSEILHPALTDHTSILLLLIIFDMPLQTFKRLGRYITSLVSRFY